MHLSILVLTVCVAILKGIGVHSFGALQPRQSAAPCPLSCPYYNLNVTSPWFLYLEIDDCGTPGTFDQYYTNCNYEAQDQGDSSYYYWCYYDPNNGGVLTYDSQPVGYGVDGSDTDCPLTLIYNCTDSGTSGRKARNAKPPAWDIRSLIRYDDDEEDAEDIWQPW